MVRLDDYGPAPGYFSAHGEFDCAPDSIFELAQNLERVVSEREPAFQYIVTTTTLPPNEFGRET